MRRAPIVLAATAAGLAAVLTFHTHELSSTVVPGGFGTVPSPDTTTPDTTTPGGDGTTSTTTPGSTSTPTTTPSGTRTALGADVQYQYGQLELKVTVTGSRITAVVPAVDVAFDPHSEQINSFAEPQLESQTLAAQSAQIDGVSGATFTSQAYVQSLQAALDKLGFK